jgi:trans-aconitate methyltransferase
MTGRPPKQFDAAYFERFYASPRTRVHGPREIARLAGGIAGLIAWWSGGNAPRSVLDVGAGPGLWRDWWKRHHPDVRYLSVDASAYACRRYGHQRRNIAVWRSRRRFDLVICQGVLHYLDDEAASAAIENLAAMSAGFLYLEAPTRRDLRTLCDRTLTDLAVHERSAAFYRSRLAPHFVTLGCGLYYSRDGKLTFYELERAR